MAKARVSTNPLYTGGAGGYTFYVRGGEQVVRQRKNNSNYGDSASRSTAQQNRRVKWANLVNFYKAIMSWQPKAYENKSQGQTDYNLFMSLNVNESPIALTKDMALQGCAVVTNYKVSRGSIPTIEEALTDPADGNIMAISLSQAISGSTTVGQFATDVIANNPSFKTGDNLAFIVFTNTQNSANYPYVSSVYKEVTLDTTNTSLLSSVIGSNRFEKTTAGNLKVNVGAADSNEAGFVLIHTRKTSGALQVSTQSIVITSESFPQEYSGADWFAECVASYGVDIEVPLDPSFNSGTISQVTANSATISNGDVLSGQQTIRVYGSNLYGSNFRLIANNVVYTPLESHDGYLQYSITANADIVLQLNGSTYLSFSVVGITTPAGLTGQVVGRLVSQSGTAVNSTKMETLEGCLNYNYQVSDIRPSLRCDLSKETSLTINQSDITPANCTITSFEVTAGGDEVNIIVQPVNADNPVYLIYEGFIFFVGNYQ